MYLRVLLGRVALQDNILLVQNDSNEPKGPGTEPAAGKTGGDDGESLLPGVADLIDAVEAVAAQEPVLKDVPSTIN